MKKEEVLRNIRKNFDEDLKNKLEPLYSVEDGAHKDTISELKELFEAVGNYAYDKAIEELKQNP